MPELPEVETVRRGMRSQVVGRCIESVLVGRERSVRRVGREAVIAGLTGTTITDVRRRGKYLLCDLDSGDAMMIHLRMSGRVLVVKEGSEHPAHTHVVLNLHSTDNTRSKLLFVDPRTFGEVVVYDPRDEATVLPELHRLGIDPIEDEFNADVLARVLHGRRGAMKSLLLNQHIVAGIGNIYADEILHRSRLRWDHPADQLSRRRIHVLADCILDVLSSAIDAGGSTLDDTQYVNVDGAFGGYQLEHRVYGRAGEPCITCGKSRIVRVTVAGRGTWYCPRCQR
jgi:formamidopyrimidine-DNA glycosylase